MTTRTTVHRLQVATVLHEFIDTKVLPGTGVASAAFWQGFDAIVADLAPKNMALLAERDRLQTEIDAWHKAHPGPITAGDPSKPTDMTQYRAFLERIGYLVTQRELHGERSKMASFIASVPVLPTSFHFQGR